MKSIACVNTQIPTIEHYIDYNSDDSLRDYDIVLFDPRLPYYNRIDFSGGGSCISIESAGIFARSNSHWNRELSAALSAGKTVFVILSAYKEDQAATSYTMKTKGQRSYSTTTINNYSVIPTNMRVRNSRGRGVIVRDSAYKELFDSIREAFEYHVVFEDPSFMRTIFVAKDGTALGGVVRFQDWQGALVLLPHFDFDTEEFVEESDDGAEVWSEKARKASHALVAQLVAIDRMLKGSAEEAPPPNWIGDLEKPRSVYEIDEIVSDIDEQLDELKRRRDHYAAQKKIVTDYSHLLYENGKLLESAIEKTLILLGYSVETLRIGDLEIDHVVVSPEGFRMIGESEGKDSSPIDISKFRQLESNIGEDFAREEISEPAKGLLFGNGFRLSAPTGRPEQFTQKSLTNAKRLGSALIRTADLYPVAVHLLNHPEDDAFRAACRAAIEQTVGGIVSFPHPKLQMSGR